jgi:hypothetical protein
MTIELLCRHCGAPFTPTKQALVRGPHFYRDCPSCRAAMLGSPDPSAPTSAGRLPSPMRELVLAAIAESLAKQKERS